MIAAARSWPAWRLLSRTPALGVWAVLHPLAENYGATTRDVYLHISEFLREDFSETAARNDLKLRFRRAARGLGLPVSGNEPTDLFFAPLGPARSQHAELARAFIGAALHVGPPAIEDTPSARAWQRRAVRDRCPGLTRLHATIDFDTSAYCARRFEVWRQGGRPHGDAENHLFEAYNIAARLNGVRRADIVGPPKLYWTGDHLALEAEPSRASQRIHVGLFPTLLPGGQRQRLSPPWPDHISWSSGTIRQDVPIGPAKGEVLLFDADSGTLLARVSLSETTAEIAAERAVALSRSAFSAPSFGDAIPSADPEIAIAWIDAGETLSFEDRPELCLQAPSDAALWIDGTALGRDGAHALYACDSKLVIKINPEVGGRKRIARLRRKDATRFVALETTADGTAILPFSEFGLDQVSDPCAATFEILAPGAAGDIDARAELSTTCWIWPGVETPDGDLENILPPGTLDTARCAGLILRPNGLSIDPRSDVETPILALHISGQVREFRLSARSEKLWHCRIAAGDRVYVPRGVILTLGHDSRHDTLLLRSPDRDASLLVLGKEKRRPFLKGQSLEIGASELEPAADGDDRIALRRADGSIDLLTRLRRIDDPANLSLDETEDKIRTSFTPKQPPDALRVILEFADGRTLEGDYRLGRHPTPNAPLSGVTHQDDPDSGQITICFDKTVLSGPGRALVLLRPDGNEDFTLVRDSASAPLAVGLPGKVSNPDIRTLLSLAQCLADPQPEALGGQLSAAVSPAYTEAFAPFSRARMLRPVKEVLNITRSDGEQARHDLAGVAPWLFEAPLHAYSGLKEDAGFAPLERMKTIDAPHPAPSLDSDTPAADWLTRVGEDQDIPNDLDAAALQHAFRTLRYRLNETDLRAIKGQGALAGAAGILCATHVGELELLRSFDDGGGGDTQPARIAALIERFARACTEQRAAGFVHDLVFRTGLSADEVGVALTLLLRAGIEFFVYFRTLWTYAIT